MFGANPATAEKIRHIKQHQQLCPDSRFHLSIPLRPSIRTRNNGGSRRNVEKDNESRNIVSFSILIKDITPRFRPSNEGDLFPGFLGCKCPMRVNMLQVSKAAFLQRANHPEALPFSIHHQLWSQIQPTLSLAQWIRLLNLLRLSKSSQNQHTNRRLSRTKS